MNMIVQTINQSCYSNWPTDSSSLHVEPKHRNLDEDSFLLPYTRVVRPSLHYPPKRVSRMALAPAMGGASGGGQDWNVYLYYRTIDYAVGLVVRVDHGTTVVTAQLNLDSS